ncbi:MAG: hypothetical protein GY808_14100 [Gammaproteobacteria bacterium]|nr:hypothetical protein [Gammaproteobacteria bacterium]
MMIRHKTYQNLLSNENGSALILAVLMLAILTIIGVSSLTTSTVEIQIAGNDKVHKTSFYAADGGTEIGREMIEQNIACAVGFQTEPLTIGSLIIEDKVFAFEENEPGVAYPSDTVRDLRFPADDTAPHTNIVVFGNTELSTGSALQIAAGYEGKGKGVAGGGAQIMYDLHSQHKGGQNSQSHIMINYRHLIGQEGNCKY